MTNPTTSQDAPLRIDFNGRAHRYRREHGGGRRQALGRALGLRRGRAPRVLDATAGLGRDGFVMATLGCQVTLCERSPILLLMLEEALERAATESNLATICARMEIHAGDARLLLDRMQPLATPRYGVVYLDPMYPDRRKSALVKKQSRILRALVGDDEDSASLLASACGSGIRRVVVKRPSRVGPLAGARPSHVIRGRTTRYDVYLNSGSARVAIRSG